MGFGLGFSKKYRSCQLFQRSCEQKRGPFNPSFLPPFLPAVSPYYPYFLPCFLPSLPPILPSCCFWPCFLPSWSPETKKCPKNKKNKKEPPPPNRHLGKSEPGLSFLSFFPSFLRPRSPAVPSVSPCSWRFLHRTVAVLVVFPLFLSFCLSRALCTVSFSSLPLFLAALLSFLRSPVPPAFSPRTRRFFLSFFPALCGPFSPRKSRFYLSFLR